MATPSASADATALDERLAAAATAGDVELIKQLIAEGADPCVPADGGMTPLMAAAEAGSAAAVAVLLEEGAPWNALDEEGYCAGGCGRDCLGASGLVGLGLDSAVRLRVLCRRRQEPWSVNTQTRHLHSIARSKLRQAITRQPPRTPR